MRMLGQRRRMGWLCSGGELGICGVDARVFMVDVTMVVVSP